MWNDNIDNRPERVKEKVNVAGTKRPCNLNSWNNVTVFTREFRLYIHLIQRDHTNTSLNKFYKLIIKLLRAAFCLSESQNFKDLYDYVLFSLFQPQVKIWLIKLKIFLIFFLHFQDIFMFKSLSFQQRVTNFCLIFTIIKFK